MVIENWSLVSEKSGKCQGIFSIPMGGNSGIVLSGGERTPRNS